jgi:hypothetical protein
MSANDQATTLRAVLRQALQNRLSDDLWLYLPETPTLHLDTPCLLLDVDPDGQMDDRGIPIAAIRDGFPNEGLDGATLKSAGEWVVKFQDPPSDELLFESFVYYLRFDAFLPAPGAPDPPPWEDVRARLDSEFIARLGPEDPTRPCRRPSCTRGAVRFSALCAAHHFENVHRRPSSG